jgi:hypothetical protein
MLAWGRWATGSPAGRTEPQERQRYWRSGSFRAMAPAVLRACVRLDVDRRPRVQDGGPFRSTLGCRGDDRRGGGDRIIDVERPSLNRARPGEWRQKEGEQQGCNAPTAPMAPPPSPPWGVATRTPAPPPDRVHQRSPECMS